MDNKLETQECWVKVDVKERLPNRGKRFPVLLNIKDKPYDTLHRMNHTGKWFDYDKNVTHWLEKRTDLYLFTKEELDAIIGNAHSIGVDRGYYEFINRNGLQKRFAWVDVEPPTAEQYIKELLK